MFIYTAYIQLQSNKALQILFWLHRSTDPEPDPFDELIIYQDEACHAPVL